MARPKKAKALTRRESDALSDAQDLVYDAWEATSRARGVALARKALELSPHCADAWSIVAEEAPAGSEEQLAIRLRAVEAGRTALGPDFDELAGEFWGFLETRPYMRAMQWLATTRHDRGEIAEAVSIYESMIELNPGDNQGVRYSLVAILSEVGGDDALKALTERYTEEDGAMWLWPLALAAFRRSGDGEESRAALAAALASSARVLPLLTGRKKLPKNLPPFYSPGEQSEAAHYVAEFGSGWNRVEGALAWLLAQPAASRKSPARRR